MQYSLLSRFQGCCLGLMLGEQHHAGGQSAPVDVAASPASANAPSDPGWSPIALDLLHAMTRSPQQHPADLAIAQLVQLSPQRSETGGIAIASLPIALFFHDDLNRQRQALWQLFEAVAVPPPQRLWFIVLAYAIAQAVKGQLDPLTFMPQLFAYIRVTAPNAPTVASVIQALEQLEAGALDGGNRPHELMTASEIDLPIAIALGCFLQTPTDFRLAVTQARRLAASEPISIALVGALAGALVGAQTGLAGIPAIAQVSSWSPLPASVAQVKHLAERLIATWSGVYDPSPSEALPPVAAPWVLR